jgi:two-component system, sensor histidine kinase LadS
MPRWMAWLLAVMTVGLAGTAIAAPAVLPLGNGVPIALDQQPHALVARGSVTLVEAIAGRLDSRVTPPGDGIVPFSDTNELWIPLQVRNPSQFATDWQLQLVLPSIDEVTLFDAAAGRWTQASAGDRIALSKWPHPGRYPRFDLRFEPRETRTLFLRVRNSFPAPVPVRLIGEWAAQDSEERAAVAFGLILGSLGLLVVASLVQAALYRDGAYLLYGGYCLLLGLAFAAIAGLAGAYLWRDWAEWNNAAKAVFPLAGAGVSVFLVRALCRVRTRGRVLSVTSAVLGYLVIAMSLVFAVLQVALVWLATLGMLLAASTVILIAVLTWRRGDRMGIWVFASHAPLIAVTALILLRMFGISPVPFDSNVLLSIAIGAILPLLLVALQLRSRELMSAQTRAREMPSIDPLTGLLSPRLFADRVRAAARRYQDSEHDAAVLYVRLANHARIREVHGSAVAEQSMIRAAIKVQRLMPDADCVGRVGESTVGLIMETVTEREPLMQRSSRLIASGLMPLKGLKPEVTLNFHIVINLFSDNPLDAANLEMHMDRTLGSLSPRTRRPIRFVEPGATQAAPLERESDRDALESIDELAGTG